METIPLSRRPVLCAALLFAVALGAVVGARLEAQDLCDPGLETSTDDPRGYQQREDRCEGIYRLKVNSDKLRLRSWTAAFEEFDPERPLTLAWSLPPGDDGPVHLRATALKPQTYYRMDTRLEGAAAPWTWRTSFLEQLGLGRADLGLLGWTAAPAALAHAAGDSPIYLPLAASQGTPSGAAQAYRVIVVPGERLLEVSWSIAAIGADGNPGAPLVEPRPLEYGYYPARRPTEFVVPAPSTPGIYVLHLTASLLNEAPAIRQIWFYHPGDRPPATATAAGGSR